MATLHVSWPSQLVQEPAPAMDAAAWQVRLYNEADGAVLSTVSEPLASLSHDFVLGRGSYHAGVQALDANGQVAGDEAVSAVVVISAEMMTVTRPVAVSIEVLP